MDPEEIKQKLDSMREKLVMKQKQLERHKCRKRVLEQLKSKDLQSSSSPNPSLGRVRNGDPREKKYRHSSPPFKFPPPPTHILLLPCCDFDSDKSVQEFVKEFHRLKDGNVNPSSRSRLTDDNTQTPKPCGRSEISRRSPILSSKVKVRRSASTKNTAQLRLSIPCDETVAYPSVDLASSVAVKAEIDRSNAPANENVLISQETGSVSGRSSYSPSPMLSSANQRVNRLSLGQGLSRLSLSRKLTSVPLPQDFDSVRKTAASTGSEEISQTSCPNAVGTPETPLTTSTTPNIVRDSFTTEGSPLSKSHTKYFADHTIPQLETSSNGKVGKCETALETNNDAAATKHIVTDVSNLQCIEKSRSGNDYPGKDSTSIDASTRKHTPCDGVTQVAAPQASDTTTKHRDNTAITPQTSVTTTKHGDIPAITSQASNTTTNHGDITAITSHTSDITTKHVDNTAITPRVNDTTTKPANIPARKRSQPFTSSPILTLRPRSKTSHSARHRTSMPRLSKTRLSDDGKLACDANPSSGDAVTKTEGGLSLSGPAQAGESVRRVRDNAGSPILKHRKRRKVARSKKPSASSLETGNLDRAMPAPSDPPPPSCESEIGSATKRVPKVVDGEEATSECRLLVADNAVDTESKENEQVVRCPEYGGPLATCLTGSRGVGAASKGTATTHNALVATETNIPLCVKSQQVQCIGSGSSEIDLKRRKQVHCSKRDSSKLDIEAIKHAHHINSDSSKIDIVTSQMVHHSNSFKVDIETSKQVHCSKSDSSKVDIETSRHVHHSNSDSSKVDIKSSKKVHRRNSDSSKVDIEKSKHVHHSNSDSSKVDIKTSKKVHRRNSDGSKVDIEKSKHLHRSKSDSSKVDIETKQMVHHSKSGSSKIDIEKSKRLRRSKSDSSKADIEKSKQVHCINSGCSKVAIEKRNLVHRSKSDRPSSKVDIEKSKHVHRSKCDSSKVDTERSNHVHRSKSDSSKVYIEKNKHVHLSRNDSSKVDIETSEQVHRSDSDTSKVDIKTSEQVQVSNSDTSKVDTGTVNRGTNGPPLARGNGIVLAANFNDGVLTVVQDELVSCWRRSLLDREDTWSAVGSTGRKTVDKGSLLGRDFLRDTCCELWGFEKTTKLEVTVYTLDQSEGDVACRSVGLERLERSCAGTEECLFLIAEGSTVVVGGNGASSTIERFSLSGDSDRASSGRTLTATHARIDSLHRVGGCSSVVAGCGGGRRVFLWGLESGLLLRRLALFPQPGPDVGPWAPTRLLWCADEKGFLFTLLQVNESEIKLSVTNLTTKCSRELQTYRSASVLDKVHHATRHSGLVVATCTNGFVAWDLATGETRSDLCLGPAETKRDLYLAGRHVVVAGDYTADVIDTIST